MVNKDILNIREASIFIGISIDTLRRWDKSGRLVAIRGGKGSHRFYKKSDLELFLKDPFALAKAWVFAVSPLEPEKDFYCSNSSIFQARLAGLEHTLKNINEFSSVFSLITSVAGEIGNNSFDHNLGSWPDTPGIFFAYDINKRMVVLADRGNGILQTLKRVKPELQGHIHALKVAFTEVITGRAPEKRGNGLKFVRNAVAASGINLIFQTGDAQLMLKSHSNKLYLKKTDCDFHGCIALVRF